MPKPAVVIVSPALASANNGNWQTAKRWQTMLSKHCRTRIVMQWDTGRAGVSTRTRDDVMIALHARRSADSIAEWHSTYGKKGLIVALTGTDLYRDIHSDAAAQHSLQIAGALVLLQSLGVNQLPASLRSKARVIYQSTTSRVAAHKTDRHLNAVMVGHLRDEKSPQTLFAAANLLHARSDILITHVGDGLDAKLADQARVTQRAGGNYKWLGAQPHNVTRSRIQRAHVLVHASKMEGGAHVVMEAVCSGTPVIASQIDGNVGMLGADYAGYFPVGDAQALAHLLVRCRDEPEFLAKLMKQCAARAHLFSPAAEQASLIQLVEHSLETL